MSKRANIYAVGRTAGVSRTVVSLVINGLADKHGISKNTQQKVRDAIASLGYTPDLRLRNLFLGRSADFMVDAAHRMDTATLIAALGPVFAGRGYQIAPASTPTPDPVPDPTPPPQPVPPPAPIPAPIPPLAPPSAPVHDPLLDTPAPATQ